MSANNNNNDDDDNIIITETDSSSSSSSINSKNDIKIMDDDDDMTRKYKKILVFDSYMKNVVRGMKNMSLDETTTPIVKKIPTVGNYANVGEMEAYHVWFKDDNCILMTTARVDSDRRESVTLQELQDMIEVNLLAYAHSEDVATNTTTTTNNNNNNFDNFDITVERGDENNPSEMPILFTCNFNEMDSWTKQDDDDNSKQKFLTFMQEKFNLKPFGVHSTVFMRYMDPLYCLENLLYSLRDHPVYEILLQDLNWSM